MATPLVFVWTWTQDWGSGMFHSLENQLVHGGAYGFGYGPGHGVSHGCDTATDVVMARVMGMGDITRAWNRSQTRPPRKPRRKGAYGHRLDSGGCYRKENTGEQGDHWGETQIIKWVLMGFQTVFRELLTQMVMSKCKKGTRKKITESLTNKATRKNQNGSGGDLQSHQVWKRSQVKNIPWA